MFQVVAGPAGMPIHVGLEASVKGNLVRSMQRVSQKTTDRLTGVAAIVTQKPKPEG